MTTILRYAFAAAVLFASFHARAASVPADVLSSWAGEIPAAHDGGDAAPAQSATAHPGARHEAAVSSWSGRIPGDPAGARGAFEAPDVDHSSRALSSWAGVITSTPEPVGAGAGEPGR